MRLVEVEFPREFKPDEATLAAMNAAVVWGPEIQLYEGRCMSWNKYLIDKDKLPAVPHAVVRYVVDTPVLDVATEQRVPMVNTKVNVMVPGLGLLNLNRVVVKTDCCTEELNKCLSQGWRIVAVCPQPDQRRPDYVLGCSEALPE